MIQLTLTLKMTTRQVVETSVTVNNNSPIQDYVHPDDQTQPTFGNITCPVPENEPFDDITWLVMKDAAPSQNLVVTKSSKPHSTVKFGYIVNKCCTFFNVTVSPIVLSLFFLLFILVSLLSLTFFSLILFLLFFLPFFASWNYCINDYFLCLCFLWCKLSDCLNNTSIYFLI